jgi:hypothetical protein
MEQIHVRLSVSVPQGSIKVIDKTPDECPICHRSITPIDWKVAYEREKPHTIERLLQCPSDACQRLFIARYNLCHTANSVYYGLVMSVPTELNTVQQSAAIQTLSTDFCNIFAEAHKAEQHKLSLVAGPGYRNALEFLIKDYVMTLKPSDKDKIENMMLANCIATYVDDDKIKQMAKRAAWLGNDETHYVRKWADKDLNDLKNLISLTLHWIEMDQLTKDFLKDMPEPGAPKTQATR